MLGMRKDESSEGMVIDNEGDGMGYNILDEPAEGVI